MHMVGPAVSPDKPDTPTLLAAPSKHSLRVAPFVFFSDFELQSDLPIFKELAGLPDRVSRELQLPLSSTMVQVYIFEDRDRYEQFMKAKYPDLPRRRAFFVKQPHTVGGQDDFLVYTYWGDRVQQDLRHELTHALLNSVLKGVPLWLDEGLAEYYEVAPEWRGVNYQHLDLLRRGSHKPDLARLEQLSLVKEMTPAEYREAWAWVHMMLQSKPEARTVLLAYLQQLRTTDKPGALRPRLVPEVPEPETALTRHLVELDARPGSPSTAQKSER